MKMLSACSGQCWACVCGDLCLAGHGDDDYSLASRETVKKRLDEGRYPRYHRQMKLYVETGVVDESE